MTSREGDGYSNEVAGFDGRYFMNDQSTLQFQYLDSRTEYPDEVVQGGFRQDPELEGDAWRVEYRYGSRNWFAFVQHQELDPSFRADSGFIGRVDVVQDGFEMSRTFYADPGAWLHGVANRHAGRPLRDYGRPVHESQRSAVHLVSRAVAIVRTPRCHGPQGVLEPDRTDAINGTTYDMKNAFIFGQFRPRSGLNINMQVNRGEQIDYTNSRLADQRGYRPQIDWNATRHLLVRLRYTSDRLSTKDGADDISTPS